MIQVPSVPIAPIMVQQPVPQQPNYNAVKIDIHNPSVGTGSFVPQYAPQYEQPTAPYYQYPQQQIYSYPQAQVQQPVYYPQTVCPPCPVQPAAPQVAQQTPVAVPAPAVEQAPATIQQQNVNVPPVAAIPPVVETTQEKAPAAPEAAVSAPEAPKAEAKPEIVPSETIAPQVDLNSFIAKLANPDFDVQASAMEEIANVIKQSPEKATELVDTKVFDALTNIMNYDSSKLEGPTAEQTAIREKIMAGQQVTDAEKEIANKISPKEQAERNKSYALFTTAMMQKLYGDEVQRLSNQTVPLTELPGAITVVDHLKDNPNPMVRASAIEALSYIQNPAYKKDLTTVFTIAQNDSDAGVSETAKAALEKLNQI
jgi:hypothetical protein